MGIFIKTPQGMMKQKLKLSHYSKEQQQIITFVKGNALVNAGAGSGKTTTAIARIQYLVQQGISEDSIVFITFAKSSANDLTMKLKKRLGTMTKINMGTMHSFALSFLRKKFSKYKIISSISKIWWQLIKEYSLDIGDADLKPLVDGYSFCRNSLFSRDELFNYLYKIFPNEIDASTINSFINLYPQYKNKHNLVDFDDMLVFFNEELEKKEVRQLFLQKYKYFIIDEAQDFNLIQHKFIDLITTNNTMLIGDVWQSIYAFRGANLTEFIKFKEKHNATLFSLSTNYRSTPCLVEHFNRLKSKGTFLPEEFNVPTIAFRQAQSSTCKVYEFDYSGQQASGIISTIKSFLQNGISHKNIAIISRVNASFFKIQLQLIKNNIPFIYKDDITAIKELFIINSFFKVFSKYMTQTMFTFEDFKKLIKLDKYVRLTNIDKWYKIYQETLEIPIEEIPEKHKIVHFIFQTIMDTTLNYSERIKKFIEFLSTDYLPHKYPNNNEAEFRKYIIESIVSLIEDTDFILDTNDNSELEKLTSFFNRILYNQNKEGVTLTTVHSAKGLEWDVVFIIDLVEGVFPHKKNNIDEELRIFYVASTRAKTHLYLSYAKKSFWNNQLPSSFINYLIGEE